MNEQPTIFQRVIAKLTSGQWILTVSCAFVFAWCSVNGQIETQAITAILSSVFIAYFNRDRSTKPS